MPLQRSRIICHSNLFIFNNNNNNIAVASLQNSLQAQSNNACILFDLRCVYFTRVLKRVLKIIIIIIIIIITSSAFAPELPIMWTSSRDPSIPDL